MKNRTAIINEVKGIEITWNAVTPGKLIRFAVTFPND